MEDREEEEDPELSRRRLAAVARICGSAPPHAHSVWLDRMEAACLISSEERLVGDNMAREECKTRDLEDTDQSMLAAKYAAAQMERERKARSEALRADEVDPGDYLEDTVSGGWIMLGCQGDPAG